jgi:hypothetical protein
MQPAAAQAGTWDFGSNIPERTGTYRDFWHPDQRIKVIVHDSHPISRPARVRDPQLSCGLADPDSSSVVPAGGWKLPANLTYRLNVNSVPRTVGSQNLVTMAANAFADWQAASGHKVTFTRGADTSRSSSRYDGQNLITWAYTSPYALGITYIRYIPDTGEVVDVDTIINKRFTWYWSNQANCAYNGVYDAEDILTHELGHWMGLDDTYDASFQDNTMFGYGATQEVKKDTLTTGDAAGVFAIYN